MREGAFGGGARDVEFRDRGPDRIERPARVSDRRFLRLAGGAQSRDGVIGVQHVAAEVVEGSHVGVELRLPLDHGGAQVLDAPARVIALDGEGHSARLELSAGLLEPLHFGGQCGRALDERRMSGSGFGRPLIQLFGGLARLEHPALSGHQPFVRRLLIAFEPRNRQARFLLPAVERVALLFRLLALPGKLLALLGEADRLVLGALQLRLLGHHEFFLLVVLGRQRIEGVQCLRDGGVEGRGFSRKARERLALRLDAAHGGP